MWAGEKKRKVGPEILYIFRKIFSYLPSTVWDSCKPSHPLDLLIPNLLPPSSSPYIAAATPRSARCARRPARCCRSRALCACCCCCALRLLLLLRACCRAPLRLLLLRACCCCSPAAACSCRCASLPRTLPPEKKWQARRRRNLFNIFILVLSTFYVSNFNILSLQFQHFKRKYWTCLTKYWVNFIEMLNIFVTNNWAKTGFKDE